MGVHKMKNFILINCPGAMTTKNFSDYYGKVIALDASQQLYKFYTTIIASGTTTYLKNNTIYDGDPKTHLYGCLSKTISCIKYGITPFMVFDGKPPSIKRDTLEKRRQIKIDAEEKLNKYKDQYPNGNEKTRLLKKTYRINEKHINDVCKLLHMIGVPYILPYGEAEAQCAALNKARKVYATATNDWDALVFGTPRMLIDFSNKKRVIEVDHAEMLRILGITHEQFVDIAILLGNEYYPGIKGIGPENVLYEYKKANYNILNVVKNIKNANEQCNYHSFQPTYEIPQNFVENIQTIRNYYLSADIVDPNNITIKWSRPDYIGLKQFMVNEHGFKPDLIEKIISEICVMYNYYDENGVMITGNKIVLSQPTNTKQYHYQPVITNEIIKQFQKIKQNKCFTNDKWDKLNQLNQLLKHFTLT